MQPLEHAAQLLSATGDSDLSRLLQFLGFPESPLPLGEAALGELALLPAITRVSVVRGSGSLRALIIDASAGTNTRELIRHTASRLAVRIPHLRWLLVVRHATSGELAIACWEDGKSAPRIVALVTRRDAVLPSDAESLCALGAAKSGSDLLTYVRWVELLGREAITRRFFRSLHDVVENLTEALDPAVPRLERRELTILQISRLLFLAFVETRGWLAADFDFLANSFAKCAASKGGYHRNVLQPLFFGTLNTRYADRAARARQFGRIPFLNGGLFTRTVLEREHAGVLFGDDVMGEVFARLLTSFRFSPREDSATWSETAIDPEILGKSFEALMAATERKTSGAFYTPQRLVEHVTESALVAALSPGTDHGVLRKMLSAGELPEPEIRSELLARVAGLRLLDPACGSGAFLVHALERIAELRLRLGEIGTSAAIRRKTLTTSLFGVDINPMAVWLCQLRLWLAVLVDSGDSDPMRATPLPNLDRQIRVGDSLMGGSFTSESAPRRGIRLARLRLRYVRAVGPRKKTLARQLDREERSEAIEVLARHRERLHAERRETLLATRTVDLFGERTPPDGERIAKLRSLRAAERAAMGRLRRLKSGAALPFAFNVHFADVSADGGFHAVVGNPPWVRIHNISPVARKALARDFKTFQHGAWADGAALCGSGRAFAGQVDIAALFVERSISLLRDNGALALLLPAKLWGSLSGGGVRELIRGNLDLIALEDMAESRSGFDAAVYPSLLVGRRSVARETPAQTHLAAAVFRNGSALQWEQRRDRLALDGSAGSPWLLIPDEVRRAFDAVTHVGIPFCRGPFGRPILGVKTGCNAAYIVSVQGASNGCSSIRSGDHSALVPAEFLRPVIRGETLRGWRMQPNAERIVWTHGGSGSALKKLPLPVEKWLSKWRPELERRSDSHSSAWWSLFRTEGADGTRHRVVWRDFGKTPRAAVLPAGEDVVPLNTCYVARCATREDALALAALLNGPLMAAWLNTLAEPARGGYRRYLGWTTSLMPLPQDWSSARDELFPLAELALAGHQPTQHELLAASLRAFHLKRATVEALLSWNCRT